MLYMITMVLILNIAIYIILPIPVSVLFQVILWLLLDSLSIIIISVLLCF